MSQIHSIRTWFDLAPLNFQETAGYYWRMGCCCALIVLGGCNVTGPSPKTHFYVLSVEAQPVRSENPPGPTVAMAGRVAVSRVTIPGTVDRPQIVARTAANSVEIYDFHRWAEPLQDAIARAVAGNLALELGPRYAVAAGAMPGLPPDVRVSLDVQKFDAVLGANVTVDALWSVRPSTGETRSGRSVVEESLTEPGHAGLVAAYSHALAAVSRDIAAAVAAAPVSRAR
jgi:uncharacterized protein